MIRFKKKNETVCWKIVRQRWSRWIEPVWIEKSCKSCSLRWFRKTKKTCGYFLWLRTPTANWYALYIRNMSSAAIPSWLEICGASRDFESWISFTWILTTISQLMVFECLWMCFLNIFAPMITKKDTKSRRLKDVKPQNSRRHVEKSHRTNCTVLRTEPAITKWK